MVKPNYLAGWHCSRPLGRHGRTCDRRHPDLPDKSTPGV